MLVKTATSRLQPGMYIANPGLSQHGNPHVFLVEGIVRDNHHKQRIMDKYSDAYVDTENGTYFSHNKLEKDDFESLFQSLTSDVTTEGDTANRLDVMLENFGKANAQYSELIDQYKLLAKSTESVSNIDVAACTRLARQLTQTQDNMLVAMLLVSRMREYDAYSYTHSLNVSLLSVVAARHLGFSEESQNLLGMSGFFHDVGKILIPDKILKKPGKLTAAEFAEIKKHPVYGREILMRQKDIPDEVVRAAHEHHENHDGSGYPNGLLHDRISRTASLISIIDTYDALRSDRYYKEAISAHKAICVIFNLKGKSFLPELVDRLVKTIGVYPVGSIVVLRSGQKAIVTEQNAGNLLRPRVRVILDGENRYCPPEDVDLKSEDADGAFGIVDTLTNKECRVHIASLVAAHKQ